MAGEQVPRPSDDEGAGAVSGAEEATRKAPPPTLTDEEKARLAAEVSRIEDA
jgi:hypothetical protein